jgi:hypothetical protein
MTGESGKDRVYSALDRTLTAILKVLLPWL